MSRSRNSHCYATLDGFQSNLPPLLLCPVRRDLLAANVASLLTPTTFSWHLASTNQSMYNTPPCLAIYMTGLVFQWIDDAGGISAVEENNKAKAAALYSAIDKSNGFFTAPVAATARSRMNVVFRIKGGDEVTTRRRGGRAAC